MAAVALTKAVVVAVAAAAAAAAAVAAAAAAAAAAARTICGGGAGPATGPRARARAGEIEGGMRGGSRGQRNAQCAIPGVHEMQKRGLLMGKTDERGRGPGVRRVRGEEGGDSSSAALRGISVSALAPVGVPEIDGTEGGRHAVTRSGSNLFQS